MKKLVKKVNLETLQDYSECRLMCSCLCPYSLEDTNDLHSRMYIHKYE